MSKNDNLLGKRLRELRKSVNYTQHDIAAVLGVVRQTYSYYENGKRKPDSETLYKLAGLYGISVEDLLHLVLQLDPNDYFDAPIPSKTSKDLGGYLDFINNPDNQNMYRNLNYDEKKLLYYYKQLDEWDKLELLNIAELKMHKYDNR